MKKIIALMLVMLALVALASCKPVSNPPAETTGNGETDAGNTTDEVTTDEPEVTTEPQGGEDTTAVADPETTEAATDVETEPAVGMTVDRALEAARGYLGDVDPDSGYKYSYQFEEITSEGEYKIKVSIYIEENDRYSKCGYLMVTPEGKITKFDW